MQQITVEELYSDVVQFFVASSGTSGDSGLRPEVSNTISLLRSACMGNPERTMQGELFAYLKTLDRARPVLEYRHHRLENLLGSEAKNGHSIDIMVFDKKYEPLAAIELKHHSRQQGTLTRLRIALDEDRQRLKHLKIPVIQIGMYTELKCLGKHSSSREKYEDFRFITAYAFDEDKNTGSFSSKFIHSKPFAPDPRALDEWAAEHFFPLTVCFKGRDESFDTREGSTVKGRVHYFVGLQKSKHIDGTDNL